MTYLVPLAELGLGDAARVGGKAAVLGELIRAGFDVPDGVAVTVEAMPSGDGDAPAGLVAEIDAAVLRLGGGPFAVRSSGIDEDLAGRSYAGQYRSTLNVAGPDVAAAVRDCWASATDGHVTAYHGGTPGGVGVIVQRMVPADAAGVAFAVNPVTGATDETLVSAVTGLGDGLMSGERDADEWTVRDGCASGTGTAVGATVVARIADLVAKVGAHLGGPQDVEWAVDGDRVWLLQARPVTAAPVPVPIDPPDGFATRHRAVDRPLTPLERSVFLPALSDGARHIFAWTTGIVPRAREIGGWVYVVVDDTTPDAARLDAVAAAIAAGGPERTVRSWHETWKPAYARRISALREADLDALDDARLARHAREVRTLFDALHDTYFRLTGAAIALLAELGDCCAETLGWDAAATLRLRGGLTGDHMAATVDMGRLAARAAANPALRERLADGPGDGPDAGPEAGLDVAGLAAVDRGFAADFAAHVARFGHRTVGFDLTAPTLAERPDVLLNLVRAQLESRYDFTAERAAIDARVAAATAEALARLTGAERTRFERALAGSAASSAVRDEKSYLAVSVWALVRYAALAAGRRLAARGQLARPADVLFLAYDDAFAALADGADRRAAVSRRRGEHAWALANPGPPCYGTPPAPAESGAVWTDRARRAERVARWSAALMVPPAPRAADEGALCGLAASAGRYRGPVRVVSTVAGFGRVRAGDVLVCPETTAQWAILFPTIGALVTDRGSLLSHPAILAREYGVPAVVATGTATRTLRDGQMVEVDGVAGTVRAVAP